MRAVGQRDPVLDALARRSELLDHGHEGEIEEDDLVPRVVHDEHELVVEEPRVDRVHDRFHARHRVVQLEVPVTVPGERPDPVTGFDAQPRQRAR
jgi:hypothetical protein